MVLKQLWSETFFNDSFITFKTYMVLKLLKCFIQKHERFITFKTYMVLKRVDTA